MIEGHRQTVECMCLAADDGPSVFARSSTGWPWFRLGPKGGFTVTAGPCAIYLGRWCWRLRGPPLLLGRGPLTSCWSDNGSA